MLSREVSLSVLPFLDVPAPEFVGIAAAARFRSVTLRVTGSVDPVPADLRDPRQLEATARRLAECGLTVTDVEVLRLGPDLDPDQLRWAVDAAAALGARHLLTVNSGWVDREPLVKQLSHVRELANAVGVRPCLEFMKFSWSRTLEDAVSAAVEAGTAVLVDTLHLARSGGGPEQVQAAIDRYGMGLFPYIQVCDAPAVAPPDSALRGEAVHARLLPGAGALPLYGTLAVLPDGLPLVVEAPTRELATLAARDRAERTMRATESFLARLPE